MRRRILLSIIPTWRVWLRDTREAVSGFLDFLCVGV